MKIAVTGEQVAVSLARARMMPDEKRDPELIGNLERLHRQIPSGGLNTQKMYSALKAGSFVREDQKRAAALMYIRHQFGAGNNHDLPGITRSMFGKEMSAEEAFQWTAQDLEKRHGKSKASAFAEKTPDEQKQEVWKENSGWKNLLTGKQSLSSFLSGEVSDEDVQKHEDKLRAQNILSIEASLTPKQERLGRFLAVTDNPMESVDALLSMEPEDRAAMLSYIAVLNPERDLNWLEQVAPRLRDSMKRTAFAITRSVENHAGQLQSVLVPSRTYNALDKRFPDGKLPDGSRLFDGEGGFASEAAKEAVYDVILNRLKQEQAHTRAATAGALGMYGAMPEQPELMDAETLADEFIEQVPQAFREGKTEWTKRGVERELFHLAELDRFKEVPMDDALKAMEMGVDMGAAILATVATGSPVGGVAYSYARVQSELQDTLEYDHGVSHDSAFGLSVLASVPTALVEYAQIKGVSSGVKGARRGYTAYLQGNWKRALGEAAKERGITIVQEIGEESAQSLIEQGMKILAKEYAAAEGVEYDQLFEDWLDETIEAAKVMPWLMGPAIGGDVTAAAILRKNMKTGDPSRLYEIGTELGRLRRDNEAPGPNAVPQTVLKKYMAARSHSQKQAVLREAGVENRENAFRMAEDIQTLEQAYRQEFEKIETQRQDVEKTQRVSDRGGVTQENAGISGEMIQRLQDRAKNAMDLEQVATQDALPDDVKTQLENEYGADARPYGYYRDGKVYLIMDNLASEEAGGLVWSHEQAHGALEALGAAQDALLANVEVLAGGEQRMRAIMPDLPETLHGSDLTHEYIARLAEEQIDTEKGKLTGLKKQIWDKLTAWAEDWLGLTTQQKLNDRQVARIVRDLMRNVFSGSAESMAVQDGQARFSVAPPVDSEAFDKWAGDAVVIEDPAFAIPKNGKPAVLKAFHGSFGNIDRFDFTMLGEQSKTLGQVSPSALIGMYFSGPHVASEFALKKWGDIGLKAGGSVYPVWIKFEKPLVISNADFEEMLFGVAAFEEHVESEKDKLEDLIGVDIQYNIESGDIHYEVEREFSEEEQNAVDEFYRLVGSDSVEHGFSFTHEQWQEWKKDLVSNGYDGVFVEGDENSPHKELTEYNVIAFDADQIRSIYKSEKASEDAFSDRALSSFQSTPVSERRGDGTTNPESGQARFSVAPPTDSEAFKKWFGDSKVVDDDGNPLVVYHGTAQKMESGQFVDEAPFHKFDLTRQGSGSGGTTIQKPGVWFAADQFMAQDFGGLAASRKYGWDYDESYVFPVYLSLKNPLVLDNGIASVPQEQIIEGAQQVFESEKYDGLIVKRGEEPYMGRGSADLYMVQSSEQIKSATDNVGTFDPNNPDIRFSVDQEWAERESAVDVALRMIAGEEMSREAAEPFVRENFGEEVDVGETLRRASSIVGTVEASINMLEADQREINRAVREAELDLRYNARRQRASAYLKGVYDEQAQAAREVKTAKRANRLVKTRDRKIAKQKKDAAEKLAALRTEHRRKTQDLKNELKAAKRSARDALKDQRMDIAAKTEALETYIKSQVPAGASEIMRIAAGDARKVMKSLTKVARPETRQRRMNEAVARIDEIFYKARRRDMIADIDKILKTRVPKVGKNKVLRGDPLTPEVHQKLELIREAWKIRGPENWTIVYDLQAELESVNRNLEEQRDGGKTEDELLGLIQERDRLTDKLWAYDTYGDINGGSRSLKHLIEAHKELTNLIQTGRTMHETFERIRRQEVELDIWKTIEAVTLGEGLAPTKTSFRKNSYDHRKNSMLQWFDNFDTQLHSFEYLLDKIIDSGSGIVQGEITKKYSRIVHQATVKSESGVNYYNRMFDEKMKEIFGVESDAELFRVRNENSTEVEHTEVFEYSRDGRFKEEMSLSKNEAYKLWQWWQDESLREAMIYNNITSDTVRQIEKFCGPQVIQWAKWQLEEFYPSYYHPNNKVYRRVYSVNMPYNPKYSPLYRKLSGKNSAEQMAELESAGRASILNRSLKARKQNMRDFEMIDGDRVLAMHVANMEHFKAWAEPTRQMNSVFKSGDVQEAVEQFFGSKAKQILNKNLDDFVRGGTDQILTIGILDKIRGNYSKAVIGLKPTIFIKQLTSIPATAMEIPVKSWASGELEFWKHPIQAIKTLSDSKWMENRYKTGWERDIIIALRQGQPKNAATAAIKRWSDRMMFLTKWGDKAAILIGGYPVYLHHYNLQKKAGKSDSAAHKKALLEFEMVSARTQVAGAVKDLGAYQRGGSVMKWFTKFRSSPISYHRSVSAAVRKSGISPKESFKRILIGHWLLPLVFGFVGRGFRRDDEEDIRALIVGNIPSLLIPGQAVDGMAALIISDDLRHASRIAEIPGGDIALDAYYGVNRLADSLRDDDITFADIFYTLDRMSSAAGAGFGIPYEGARNQLRGLYDAINDETDKPIRRALGFSPYALGER